MPRNQHTHCSLKVRHRAAEAKEPTEKMPSLFKKTFIICCFSCSFLRTAYVEWKALITDSSNSNYSVCWNSRSKFPFSTNLHLFDSESLKLIFFLQSSASSDLISNLLKSQIQSPGALLLDQGLFLRADGESLSRQGCAVHITKWLGHVLCCAGSKVYWEGKKSLKRET